jgi:hypothetical protein
VTAATSAAVNCRMEYVYVTTLSLSGVCANRQHTR